MRRLIFSALIAFGCGGGGGGDSDAPDAGPADPFEPLTLEARGSDSVPYAGRLFRGPKGEAIAAYDDQLWSSTDGVAWTSRVSNAGDSPVFITDEFFPVHSLRLDPTIGQTGGMRVERINADNTRMTLAAPWDTLDVTTVDLVASGSTLWVQVGSRVDNETLDRARFYRLDDGASTWQEATSPGTAPRWHMADDGAGGLWVSDQSSQTGPWRTLKTGDGGAWTEVFSSATTVPTAFHAGGGVWFVSESNPSPMLYRSTDAGDTWTTEALTGPHQLSQAPNGQLVRVRTPFADAVDLSEDLGITWTAVPPADGREDVVLNFVALDGKVIGTEDGFIVQRPHADPRWRMVALPSGPGREYLDVEAYGDRIVTYLFDGIGIRDRQTNLLVSDDAGETWFPGPQGTFAGNAICGGANGWFVGGGTGHLEDNNVGAGWSHLSPDATTVVQRGVIHRVGDNSVQLGPIVSSAGGEIVDCTWSDSGAANGLVRLSVSRLDRIEGILLDAVIQSPMGSLFSWEPLDAGAAMQAPQGIAARGVAIRGGVAGGTTTVAYHWDETNGTLQWKDRDDAAIDDAGGVWGFANGTLSYFGYIGNGVYNDLDLPITNWPTTTTGAPARLNGIAIGSDGRLWVASESGLLKSINSLPGL